MQATSIFVPVLLIVCNYIVTTRHLSDNVLTSFKMVFSVECISVAFAKKLSTFSEINFWHAKP